MKNTAININSKEQKAGYYGEFGGAFIPPVLESNLKRLENAFLTFKDDKDFKDEFHYYLHQYTGRPSPLYFASRLSEFTGSKIYLKREDLNHTGSHKINNTIGQILLAKRMGATEILAETGAGQHGVATATAAALMGMKCKIFMGQKDIERQSMNVSRIRLLGAEMIPATSGTQTLKDAVDAALGYFIENPDSFYLLGSQVGPHPYPMMVGYFQQVIGREARQQILEQEGRLPDKIFACVGGGSNAIGLFQGFLEDKEGKPDVSYSIAAGLDYPGISPQHAYLHSSGRASYFAVTDKEAIEAYINLSKLEGIIPAIESAHAIALAVKILKNKGELAIVNLSGRGDKDVERKLQDHFE